MSEKDPTIEVSMSVDEGGADEVIATTPEGATKKDMAAQDPMPNDVEAEEAVPAVNEEYVRAPSGIQPTSFVSVAARSVHLNQVEFKDHHTLKAPSNTVRLAEKEVRIYGQRNSQFILEEREGTVTAKVAKDGSVGLSFLRLLYTLVALLMTGFLLIFCLQLLLFLFLSLTSEAGLTSDAPFHFGKFIGALLSVPIFVYSLACALAIAASFVTDTWGGHTFINTISRWKDVSTQWFSFFIFLGIPVLVMIGGLFSGNDDWWSIFALAWFSAVFAYYCFFAAFVVIFEVGGCLELVRRHPKVDVDENSIRAVLKGAILLRQKERLSGKERKHYLVRGSQEGEHLKESTKIGLYSRFTKWSWLHQRGIYDFLDDPTRIYTIEEVQDIAPYVTVNTWSLEKLYCRARNQRYIAVVNGKAAVTPTQVKSSFYCAMLGSVIVILLLISFLVWLDSSAGAIAFATVVVAILMIPSTKNSYALYKMFERTKYAKKNDDVRDDDVLYQVWESSRITRPNVKLCWAVMGVEIVLFYIAPLISLFSVGNIAISVLFLIMGFISLVRFYFNAAALLMELGNIDILDEDTSPDWLTSGRKSFLFDEDYREKNRLSLIINKISQGRRRNVWIWVFVIVVGLFCLLFLAAYGVGTDEGADDVPTPLYNFTYSQKNKLPYPTCRMGNGLEIPNSPETALADYAYLSAAAYTDPAVTQDWLNNWFGENVAQDEQAVVDNFRENVLQGPVSSVSYKLISFPAEPNFAIVSIRGTANGWDALSDAQLWSAAALAQYVRAILPLGQMWTPILENLVFAVSLLENHSLEKVSFYKQTTAFVKYLKDETQYTNVHITGHSLGGGLAMITGSQTKIAAIALSGPNAMISRKTFDPPLTRDELDKYTFNIVPAKDPVPRIDDLARLYQRIDCTAPDNNFVDCHTARRSVCEILYTCGSNGRPTFCYCVETYGYPEPDRATGNETFAQACSTTT